MFAIFYLLTGGVPNERSDASIIHMVVYKTKVIMMSFLGPIFYARPFFIIIENLNCLTPYFILVEQLSIFLTVLG